MLEACLKHFQQFKRGAAYLWVLAILKKYWIKHEVLDFVDGFFTPSCISVADIFHDRKMGNTHLNIVSDFQLSAG